jgi:hypothetical protein
MLRRFFQYMRALCNHGYLMTGSAIFGLPNVVEFFFPETHPYIDPVYNRILATGSVRWIVFGSLLFFATFLVWDQERTEREKTTKTIPEELKNQVKTLTEELADARNILASRWQSLSDQQRADFVAVLREFGASVGSPGPGLLIFPDFTLHDALELSNTFTRLCAEAHWSAHTVSRDEITDYPPGLIIYAKADQPDVQTFTKALERANLPYELTPKNRRAGDVFEITIGRRIA